VEESATISNALDLKQFLNSLPDDFLADLPVIASEEDGAQGGDVTFVEAFEVRETEGCLERGFRFTFQRESYENDEEDDDGRDHNGLEPIENTNLRVSHRYYNSNFIDVVCPKDTEPQKDIIVDKIAYRLHSGPHAPSFYEQNKHIFVYRYVEV